MIGLARLGHDVFYYEDTWSWPYHPLQKKPTEEGDYSAKYVKDFFQQYAPDLSDRWHYLHLHEMSYGMSRETFDEVARTADLFLNVSGACIFPENVSSKCIKVFLDTDPGYNQIILSERPLWSENVDRWCEHVEAHDRHFTYAENIHGVDCLVPRMRLAWKTTRMPVVLDLWKSLLTEEPGLNAPWSTVMSWNAFKGKLVYNNVEYKSKAKEFEKVVRLPRRIDVPFKIAVGGVSTRFKWPERHGLQRTSQLLSYITRKRTFRRLARYGWRVVDGPDTTLTPEQYQAFIAGSRAEMSIAKDVYVALKTGWFSCRSACYLAAGRPVVVQDTGFSSALPVGKGILSFNTTEEASEAIREVEKNYMQHCKAACEISSEHFDSDKVLALLLDEAMSSKQNTMSEDVS